MVMKSYQFENYRATVNYSASRVTIELSFFRPKDEPEPFNLESLVQGIALKLKSEDPEIHLVEGEGHVIDLLDRRIRAADQDGSSVVAIEYHAPLGSNFMETRAIVAVYETFRNIKASLPKVDFSRFEKIFENDFSGDLDRASQSSAAPAPVSPSSEVAIVGSSYIRTLQKHIDEQVAFLSESLGRQEVPVGYTLTPGQLSRVLTEMNLLAMNALQRGTTHRDAVQYFITIRQGLEIVHEHTDRELFELDALLQVEQNYRNLERTLYDRFEGLDMPHLMPERNASSSVRGLEQELSASDRDRQNRLSDLARLDGDLTHALRAEDFERAALLRDKITKIERKNRRKTD